jgi:hypothetical protein
MCHDLLMLVAAAVVGLITAYYLGLRAGMYAAIAAGLLFLAAMLVPAMSTIAYAIVAVGLIGVLVIGPRRERPSDSRRVFGWLKKRVTSLWKKKD